MHVDVYAFVVDASAGQSLHIAESPGCFQVFVCSPGSGCSLQGGCMEKRINYACPGAASLTLAPSVLIARTP